MNLRLSVSVPWPRRSWAGSTSRSSRARGTAPSRPGSRASPGWTGRASGRSRRSSDTTSNARYRRDPEGTLAKLERIARQGPERRAGLRPGRTLVDRGQARPTAADAPRKGRGALHHYVDTVAYAYDYLFDPDLAAGRRTIDPRYRLACDLYNGALDRLLRAAKAQDKLQPGGAIHIKIGGAEHVFRLALEEHTPWKTEDVHELLLASDFEVSGLDSTQPPVRPGRADDRRPPRRPVQHEAGQGAGQVLPARDGLPAHGHPPPDQGPARGHRPRRHPRMHDRPGRSRPVPHRRARGPTPSGWRRT